MSTDVRELGDLLDEVFSLSEEAFSARYPYSFLVMEVADIAPGEVSYQTMASSRQRTREAAQWKAYPVKKSDRNKFTNMITIGRTQNNDIIMDDPSVSKFHAYLQGEEGQWKLCDAGSSFGTFLDGAKLDDTKGVKVLPTSRITLGTGLNLKLYTSLQLYQMIRVYRGLGKL